MSQDNLSRAPEAVRFYIEFNTESESELGKREELESERERRVASVPWAHSCACFGAEGLYPRFSSYFATQ